MQVRRAFLARVDNHKAVSNDSLPPKHPNPSQRVSSSSAKTSHRHLNCLSVCLIRASPNSAKKTASRNSNALPDLAAPLTGCGGCPLLCSTPLAVPHDVSAGCAAIFSHPRREITLEMIGLAVPMFLAAFDEGVILDPHQAPY